MGNYLVKRLLQIIPVLLGVTVLTFLLMRLAPGDAALMKLQSMGIDPTPEALFAMRERLGLDQPLFTQYWIWLGDVLRLDLGNSIITGRPVLEEFALRFSNTLQLALASMGVIAAIAFPVGVLSAMRKNRMFDGASRMGSIFIMSIPSYCVGLLLIILFSVKLRLLPSFGTGTPLHIVMPSLALSLGLAAYYSRFIRSTLLEELSKDYIKAARARGASTAVLVWRHALKNAATPIITSLGMSFGLLLGGSAVVELIFSWPGVGKYLVESILQRDYPAVQGCVFLIALLFVAINLCIDIVCMLLDPRTRGQRSMERGAAV
ncbi:ABC transporter permease [Christensenellaceae bacterium OttesenSCG-928-K19]|nr:ABC transporter permease [Christensenellaceae bacterium OttesenSCG-928-K19]